MEKLNLVEILENAPLGIILYSTIFGDVEFMGSSNGRILIRVKSIDNNSFETLSYFSDGRYYKRGECTLFPSSSNREWSTFKVPKKYKHFEPFEKVLVVFTGIWTVDLYSYYNRDNESHYTIGMSCVQDEEILPYKGNEDKLGKPVE